MATTTAARRVPLGAEIALAFAAGAASFAVVAVPLAVTNSNVLAVLLGVVCIAAVAAMFRFWGMAYAIPAAMAGALAYDWFHFPPTHIRAFPDSGDLVNLLTFIAAAVAVGELAAYADRRADVSEVARSELADEQAALRRVATLVARGVAPEVVFAAVAQEVGALLEVDGAGIVRYEDDEHCVQVAGWGVAGHEPSPMGRTKTKIERTTVVSEVLRTGRVARIDDYARANRGVIPRVVQIVGMRSGVGAPIVVDGRLWGVMITWSVHPESLADTAEARLADFTGLVATAISNTASREELARLADEQAALRRVATLVAQGVPPPEMFSAVAREVGRLLGVDAMHLGRYEPDGAATAVAAWSRAGEHIPTGVRVTMEGENVVAQVMRTGRPARLNSYDDASGPGSALARELGLGSSVGAPIVVEGRLWGVMVASSKGPDPLPVDTESRIAGFAELVATAISNTEARIEVGRLAEEQAALRRVATLVARGVPPGLLFSAVAEEVGRLLGSDSASMVRYQDDGTVTFAAQWGEPGFTLPARTNLSLGGENIPTMVFRTGRPARIDDHSAATGAVGDAVRQLGTRSALGCPIVVDGRLWGAMIAAWGSDERAPPGSESRIKEFTELIATAIANVQARSDLAASRTRIAAAADQERQRVVRDLHDGAQQRVVHTIITLKLADQALQKGEEAAPELVAEALHEAETVQVELHELAHGILPAVLTRGGLRAGVEALAVRTPVPVDVDVSVERLPDPVEATAYFVVAEALTNVAKHSHAEHATVAAHLANGTLQVQVRDDGVGGAQPDSSGLVGLRDRLAALDGRLSIESPAGGGTLIGAVIPLSARAEREPFSAST
ncbi:MAG: hypothetical protein QOH62_1156 [Solirubrobacteraceae bacterium]|nr:hypothetical protein [Solirubrobacteraceae bacterium]